MIGNEDLSATVAEVGAQDFSLHEVLDRISVFAEMWDIAVVRHPQLASESDIAGGAEQIAQLIGDLYQLVGQHSGRELDPSTESP